MDVLWFQLILIKATLPFIAGTVRQEPSTILNGKSDKACHVSVSVSYLRRPVGLADPPRRMRMFSN